ncbi:hypothetical protein [Streptomyces sp. LUP47B]|uniref:hypothetical protein n=1 Tax=Streptomyces sp. LUP47B TaxID=1890286 RepID=UPI00114D272D|nr:hypothetical protein [Streptomyces sp. LUP47B]
MTTEHIKQPWGQTGHSRGRLLAGAGGGAGTVGRAQRERSKRDERGILHGEMATELRAHLNESGKTTLGGHVPGNREQLLIHPAGALHNRPTARTAVPAGGQRAAGRGQFGRR